MDNVITIISVAASILSIIGFILSIKCKDSIINKICYILIIILTVATSYLYTQYKHITDEQLCIERRKQEIKHEAKKILDSSPTYISYWDPGENEGLLYSTLGLLERNRDIYPEMYELYKENVLHKINKANNEDDLSKRREQLEIAGSSALQLLKTLAQ